MSYNNVIAPSWIEVDLDRLKYNIQQIRESVDNNTMLMAVVKADGYGHGAVKVSELALKNGVEWLGVAQVKEAINLRRNGFDCPILVLGGILANEIDDVIGFDLSQTVFTVDIIQRLNRSAAKKDKKAKIHLKIDTGMSRLGVYPGEELRDIISTIKQCSNIHLEGVYTHFSLSDVEDKSFTLEQFQRFNKAVAELRKEGLKAEIYHCCNSGAMHDCRNMCMDMIRTGISIYGYYPSDQVKRGISLKPVLSWKTRVVHIKDVPVDTGVSYGRTYITNKPIKIAIISIGYEDGYRRILSNKGQVMVGGKKAPIIGMVCMDQCMIDITHIEGVRIGDEVVLIGQQGNEIITADDLAKLSNTISYEILTGISNRVKRVYVEEGEFVIENEQK